MGWVTGGIFSIIGSIVGLVLCITADLRGLFLLVGGPVLAIIFFTMYQKSRAAASRKRAQTMAQYYQPPGVFPAQGYPSAPQTVRAAQSAAYRTNANYKKPDRPFPAKHLSGLPLAQDISCTITADEHSFKITGGGNSFELEKYKVTSIDIKTDREIQQQYVSSIGGAVAGAALFGPLGAIIGGRAKKKTVSEKVQHYLIFTYRTDGEIRYVGFEIYPNSLKWARRWIQELNDQRRLTNGPGQSIKL